MVIKSPEAMKLGFAISLRTCIRSVEACFFPHQPKPKAQAQSIRLYFKGSRQTKPSRSIVTETRRNGHGAITQAQHKVNPFNSNCTCDDVPWDPSKWLKSGSQNCHTYEALFSSFGTMLEALMECLPIQKHSTPCLYHYLKNNWSASLTFSHGRYIMIISAATQAMMKKVMEKTRLGQMKPRELS